jgi:hypothetical protein
MRGSATTSTRSRRCSLKTRRSRCRRSRRGTRRAGRSRPGRASLRSGAWHWKPLLTEANAQPALAFYAWDEPAEAYLPFALNVLSLREGLVSDVTAFIVRAIGAPEPEAYQRFPEQPLDQRQLSIAFERFGLPNRLRSGAVP